MCRNHEFDGLDFDATTTQLRTICDALAIDWLERETVVVQGVRFVGTTLWSDFEALAQAERDPAKRLKALEKAYRAANFYLRKNTCLRGGKPMLAEELRALALECQQWLIEALTRPFEGPTVTVTHFAPTLHSADPRYGKTPGTAGFCNALDALLPLSQIWMHGHLHCPNDFVVSGNDQDRNFSCRVVANPRGYFSKGEQATFRERFVVTV